MNSCTKDHAISAEQMLRKSESLNKPHKYLLDSENPSPLECGEERKQSKLSHFSKSNDKKSTGKRNREYENEQPDGEEAGFVALLVPAKQRSSRIALRRQAKSNANMIAKLQ